MITTIFKFLIFFSLFINVFQNTHAAIFIVNTTDDYVDASPSDGICLDTNQTCSLRAAIMQANA